MDKRFPILAERRQQKGVNKMRHYAENWGRVTLLLLLMFSVGGGYADDGATAEPPARGVRDSDLLRDSGFGGPLVDGRVTVVSYRKVIEGDFVAAYFTADPERVILTGPRYRGLYLASADGSRLETICDDKMAGWRPLALSHGQVVFRSADVDSRGDPVYDIKIYHLSTKKTDVIYRGTNEDVYPPKPSNYGDGLVFVKDRTIVAVHMGWVRPPGATGTQEERIVFSDHGRVWSLVPGKEQPREISNGRDTCGGEALSPDGRKAAYLHGNTNSVIIYDFESGREIDIGRGANLSWSPDGEMLAYVVSCDDGHDILSSDIFVINADGSGKQQLTFTEGIIEVNPSWSPDGRRIIFADAAKSAIYMVELRY
ncbi:MAG: hypothetical protein Q8Q12_04800 [bacterium]|nr:hypothetical protein [bacterium]